MTSEEMATESASADSADDGPLYCYRHPNRETYVRCGRCDRPICSSCAMQGPVGFRCRQCGKPARDPLTSLTARQLGMAAAIAVGGGLIIGLIGAQFGWLSLIIAFFGGSFTAEGIRRAIGYKQGPRLLAVAVGGVLLGTIGGYGADLLLFDLALIDELADEGVGLTFWLPQVIAWGLLDGVLAGVGAYTRLR